MAVLIALSVFVCAALLAVELALRAKGWHRPILFEETSYGYRIKPSQAFRAFGRESRYNAQGARSDPVDPQPPAGTLRILCIGDSITNGGVLTDQAETIPDALKRLLVQMGYRVEVLNVSANGWSLENEEGWLREHGTLGSHLVVWQVASHDMHQRAASAEVLRSNPAFPAAEPTLALQYVYARYVRPRLPGGRSIADPGTAIETHSIDDIERSVAVLDRVHARVEQDRARLMVWHIGQPAPHEPTDDLAALARRRLWNWVAQSGVPFVSVDAALELAGGASLFRDAVHPNAAGNEAIARALVRSVATEIDSICPACKRR